MTSPHSARAEASPRSNNHVMGLAKSLFGNEFAESDTAKFYETYQDPASVYMEICRRIVRGKMSISIYGTWVNPLQDQSGRTVMEFAGAGVNSLIEHEAYRNMDHAYRTDALNGNYQYLDGLATVLRGLASNNNNQ